VLEIGAGTGIATEPLVNMGFKVTAIEPAPAMAAIAVERIGSRASVVVDRFENWVPIEQVQMVLACNAWHWIDPNAGLPLVRALLPSGGTLALVWTETVSWGEPPFEGRVTKALGAPWPKRLDHVFESLRSVEQDPEFGDFQLKHHRFERTLHAVAGNFE
jgi:SAM-dependent methyltransferase